MSRQCDFNELRAWRYAVGVLCLSVFLLGLHAKLSLYDTSQKNAVDPYAASKLMAAEQKMDVRATGPLTPVAWCCVLILLFAFRRSPERAAVLVPAPSGVRNPSRFQLHRFLRPPPAR